MGGLGERSRIERRFEGACKHEPLGVRRPKPRVHTKELIKLFYQIVGECEDTFVLRQWH
jgi:hypothetical protein